MNNHAFRYLAIFISLLLIVACFIPWISFPAGTMVFTGFKTDKFANGVNYGQPGYFISILSIIIALLLFIPKALSLRAALFFIALLTGYGIRTYNLFTSSLFEGDVIKHTGIYLVLILPALLLVFTILSFSAIRVPKKEHGA